jgi:uncharacterized SAM-binding protein YcdF (DUF218 family)
LLPTVVLFAQNSDGLQRESLEVDKPSKRQTVFLGLFSRRLRWGLSLRGFLLAGMIFALALGGLFTGAYPFLAINDPVASDTLVVEGWMDEYAIKKAAAEYASGHYHHLFTTGGPVPGKGGYTNDYNTFASVGAELLRKTGIPHDAVQMVPSRVADRDRTYSSAVALRDWLAEHHMELANVDVVTEEAHARRTRLLFQQAFGRGARVGIIAVRSPDYDARYWWRSSEGAREVIGEAVAYLYAKLLFQPRASTKRDQT